MFYVLPKGTASTKGTIIKYALLDKVTGKNVDVRVLKVTIAIYSLLMSEITFPLRMEVSPDYPMLSGFSLGVVFH